MMTFNIFKIFLLTCLCGLALNAQVVTSTKVITSNGEGIGITREEAVSNAIVEAVGKVNGVSVSRQTKLKSLYVENSESAKSKLTYNSSIDKITKGKVTSYEIDNIFKNTEGLYEASVTITNKKISKAYKLRGVGKNRRSIVVVPANLTRGSFNILGEQKSSPLVNINLSQELLNSITQTRKFKVLDREESRAFYHEQSVFKSNNSHRDEALKLGNVLGADYLLLTSIKDLSIGKTKANSYLSTVDEGMISSVTVQFKVITTSTRQVKFANTKNYKFSLNGDSNKEIYYSLLGKISNEISKELINNIYPIKIVQTNGKEISLNQGMLAIGTKYEVFKLGKKIVDSYTKESLGRSESKVGTIEIVRSLPKFSIAKIVEGKVKTGNIARNLGLNKDKSKEIYKELGREANVNDILKL